MKKTNTITEAYETGREDFMVDIVQTEDRGEAVFEAWLYRRSVGVKTLLYGVPAEHTTAGAFYESVAECMVAGNKVFDEYDEEVG